MAQTERYQEILRRLAIIDEGLVDDPTGLDVARLAGTDITDPTTGALVRVGVLVALGAPAVCLEWSTNRALAAGATEDEITDVLAAIAPMIGLSQITAAAPVLAAALGYDVEAALHDPDGS